MIEDNIKNCYQGKNYALKSVIKITTEEPNTNFLDSNV